MLILVFVSDEIRYFGEVNGRKSSLRTIAKYLASRQDYYMIESKRGRFEIYDKNKWFAKYVGYFYILDTSEEEFVICPELEFGRYGVLANLDANSQEYNANY